MFNPNEHMMSLKGKDYLQVMWRIVWLRDEHPDWQIKTEMLHADDNGAVFRAEVANAEGFVLATGHGSETKRDFGDYLEKAETKAVGRALAMLGYGTQFAPELDECENAERPRIVDSPVERRPKEEKPKEEIYICEECYKRLEPYKDAAGRTVPVKKHADKSKEMFGKVLCLECIKKEQTAEE